MREPSPRYAASTYALCLALHEGAVLQSLKDVKQGKLVQAREKVNEPDWPGSVTSQFDLPDALTCVGSILIPNSRPVK